MDKSKRKIAMTDLETSGDIFGVHEILEIGLVVFDPKTFEIFDSYNRKVKPEKIENAVQAAIDYNGYNEKDWRGAISLQEGARQYSEKTKGAIFCAYNATFDWGFMNNAFRETGIKDEMDYHRLDLLSIAWAKGMKESDKWNLKIACEMFGVPKEPEPPQRLERSNDCV